VSYRRARRERLARLRARHAAQQCERVHRLFHDGTPRAWVLALAGCNVESFFRPLARERVREWLTKPAASSAAKEGGK